MKLLLPLILAFFIQFTILAGGGSKAINLEQENLENKLLQNLLENPNEKLSIVTDRDVYYVTENLWFTALSVDDATNIPVKRSKVYYSEIINAHGHAVTRKSVINKENSISGHFILPDTLSSGMYYIRVYSQWMKNFMPENYGKKLIQIINPNKLPILNGNNKKQLKVSFEGGKFMPALANKVIVEYPADITSVTIPYVSNINGDTLLKLLPLAQGIAYAEIPPMDTNNLFIVAGKLKQKIGIKNNNAGIKVNSTDKTINVHVNALNKPLSKYRLLVVSQGKLIQMHSYMANSKPITSFSKNDLPKGVLEFVLLENNNTVSSRLWFNGFPQQARVDVSLNKVNFNKGEQAALGLLVADTENIEQLSVSVHSKVLQNKYQQLNSDFYINAYLNAYASMYNLSLNKGLTESTINQLLIATENDRFNIQNALNEATKKNYAPEISDQTFTGVATDKKTGAPVKNDILSVYFVGEALFFAKAHTNSKGEFEFNIPAAHLGKKDVVFEAENYPEPININISPLFDKRVSDINLNFYPIDTALAGAMDQTFVNWQLGAYFSNATQPVYQYASKENYNSVYGNPDLTIQTTDYIELDNVAEVFHEMSDGCKVRKRDGKYELLMSHYKTNLVLGDKPLVLLNSVPVKDFEAVLNMHGDQVRTIYYVRQHFYIYSEQYDGVINLITVENDELIGIAPSAYRIVHDFNALSAQFRYPKGQTEGKTVPFVSNTLYWNPNVNIESKTVDLQFYTGQTKGDYTVRVRGITTDGRVIEEYKDFSVE